MAYRLIHS